MTSSYREDSLPHKLCEQHIPYTPLLDGVTLQYRTGTKFSRTLKDSINLDVPAASPP